MSAHVLSSFVCKATRTAYSVAGPNLYHLSLVPPTRLLDCERFEIKAPSVPGGSVLGTITHSGFEITEADEMYHTVWKNVDNLKEEVRCRLVC